MNDLEEKLQDEQLPNLASSSISEEEANISVKNESSCEINDECAETTSPAEAISEATDVLEPEVEESSESTSADEQESTDGESPKANIFAMSKEELLQAIKDILSENRMDAHKEVSLIKQAFFNIRSKETMEEVNAFVENGGNPQEFSSQVDEAENEFKTLYAEFKTKRAEYVEEIEKKRQENLLKKQEILDKLIAISEDIDNVNTKFPEFQQLQQDFKAINDIPATAETEIWKNFQTTVEKFYDHLKMNKELRDLDFKKNLEAKKSLIEEARKLQDEADPVSAFRSLQILHNEWRNVGPVAKELRDAIWDEFKELSTTINKRHQDFFEKRKAEELANELEKTKLCEAIEAIDLNALTSFNLWTAETEKVIDLQKKWKEFGFASKKVNNLLYSRFRAACDAFFAAKTEYFKKTKDEFAENLLKKTALCEKVEALKELNDIHKATAEVIKLQGEWKKIGSVPRKNSDEIWARFQTACNYFFEERKKANSAKRTEEQANLAAKQDIIAKLKELPLDGERKEVIGKVKELQAQWQTIGFVPFKLKDKVFAEYREICDTLYNTYDLRESKARMNNFREKVNAIKGSDQADKERDKLYRALEARKNDLKNIENNLGFFNVKSSAGNSLLKEMENKIKRLKEDIAQIEEKIELLNEK